MRTNSLHLEGIFLIFFTSQGAHPPQIPPFEGCIQVLGKIQSYCKKGNEQEVHLFSLKKKKKSNKSTRSLYLKYSFKNFHYHSFIDRELCMI